MSRHAHLIGSAGIAVLVATTCVATAQPKVDITVGQALDAWTASGNDSNDFRTVLAAAIEQAFADARGRAWASSDLFTYASEATGHTVQLASGASWKLTLSEDRSAIYVGGSGLLRRNGDAWTAADVTAGSAFANIAWTPRATASARAGYSLDVRRFDDIASLDHVQHTAFVSGLVNLPSRTTLVGEITLGAKHYAGDEATAAMALANDSLACGRRLMGTGSGAPVGTGIGAGGTTGEWPGRWRAVPASPGHDPRTDRPGATWPPVP